MAFSDATFLWNLNESTLRKAIAYGKLVNGVDVCKFGKQWVVSTEAMKREYGDPVRTQYPEIIYENPQVRQKKYYLVKQKLHTE